MCKKTGLGDLVSIESKAEWTFLKNTTLNLTMAGEYFIGLRKDGRSGQWGWLSNKSTSQTVLPWAKFEPSGDGNCAAMYKDYRGDYGKYNDLGCSTHAGRGYICEFPVDRCKQEGKSCTFHTFLKTIVFDIFHLITQPIFDVTTRTVTSNVLSLAIVRC